MLTVNFDITSAVRSFRHDVIMCNRISSRTEELAAFIHGPSRFYPITAQCTLVQSAVLRSHVVCPSVDARLSVTLVDCDHIGWKSWKLIVRTISPTSSLFIAERRFTYSQGNMGKFWGDYEVGYRKKRHAGEQKRQYL